MEWTVIAKDKMPGAPDIRGYTKRCWITSWPIRYDNILVNGRHVHRVVYYLVASYSPNVEEYDKDPSDVAYKFVFKYAIQDRHSDSFSPGGINPRELNQKFVDIDDLRGALLENDGEIDWKYEVSMGYGTPILSVDVDEYDNGVPVFNVHVGKFFASIDSCDMRRYASPIGQIMGKVGNELGWMCMFPGKLDFAKAHAAVIRLTQYNYAMIHESIGYYDKERTEARKCLEEDMDDLKEVEDGFTLVSQKSADSLNALSRDYGIEIAMEEEEFPTEPGLTRISGVSRPIIRGHLSSSFRTRTLGAQIKGCGARFVVNVYKDRAGKFLAELCEDAGGERTMAKPLDANWLRGFLSSALSKLSEWGRFRLVDLNGHLYLEGEYDTKDIMPHTTPKEEFVRLSGLEDLLNSAWGGGLGDHLAIAYIFRDRISDIDEAQTVMNHIGEVYTFINELNYQDKRVEKIREYINSNKIRLSDIDQSQREEIEDKIEALEFLKGIGVFT